MLKRELKINLKGLLIWTGVLSFLLILVYSVYPSLFSSDNKAALDSFVDVFPPEMLSMFNMDIISIDTAYGWILTEGVVFMILIGSIYSGNIGSTILLKEENDKTIEFLYSKPVSKRKILTSKFISGIINIIAFSFIIYIVNIIGLELSGEFNFRIFTLVSIGILLLYLTIYSICFSLSTLFRKTKGSMGVSLLLVFLSYFLQIIGNMGDKVKLIKYFSVFELMSPREILLENNLNITKLFISIGIIIITYVISRIIYDRKEFL